MSSHYSSGVSTVSIVRSSASSTHSGSHSSQRHEAKSAFQLLKAESHDNNKAIITVVRPESFSLLDRKVHNPWWKFWKLGKGAVLVTTPDWLQRTIDHVTSERRWEHITVFVSNKIAEIEFDVSARIRVLSVFRCHHDPHTSRGRLLVRGSSTFSGVRLDEWQDRKHRHALYLGEGVGISVDMASGTSWAGSTAMELSDRRKEQLYGHFLCMKQQADQRGDEPEYIGWRRHMAIVTGLLTGVGDMVTSFDATKSGCAVDYKFGATTTDYPSTRRSRTIKSAAGPAGLLTAGVPAPIYSISWSSLLSWIGNSLSRLCQRYWGVLQRLLQWVTSRLLGIPDMSARPVRPPLGRSKSSRDRHVSWANREKDSGIMISESIYDNDAVNFSD